MTDKFLDADYNGGYTGTAPGGVSIVDDDVKLDGNLTCTGDISCDGLLTAGSVTLTDVAIDSLDIGSTSHHTAFDATGHQTMVGDARPWDDVRIEPIARTTGTNAPAFEQYFTNGSGSRGVYLYSFDDAAANAEKEIFFTLQLPHAWAQNAIHLHVHWTPSVADTSATPRWGLEYNWVEPGGTFGNTTIIHAVGNEQGDANLTQHKHYITEFDPLTPSATQDGISSIIIGRLFRNSSDAADTYDAATNKCGLLYIDAHYQLSSLGSTEEYTK